MRIILLKDNILNLYILFDGREKVLDAFESEKCPIKIEGTCFLDVATRDKVSDHFNLKILTPKQMLQRLPIAKDYQKQKQVAHLKTY